MASFALAGVSAYIPVNTSRGDLESEISEFAISPNIVCRARNDGSLGPGKIATGHVYFEETRIFSSTSWTRQSNTPVEWDIAPPNTSPQSSPNSKHTLVSSELTRASPIACCVLDHSGELQYDPGDANRD